MSAPTPPELPSFTNKTTFFALAQGLFVWLTTTFMTWVDATATAMNLNSTNDVSTSSVLIGTGSKSLTVSASKSYVGGMYVVISDNTTPGTTNSVNSMTGQITSYNSSTGALVVNVLKVLGSGTKTAWVISQCAPPSLEVWQRLARHWMCTVRLKQMPWMLSSLVCSTCRCKIKRLVAHRVVHQLPLQ